MNCKLGEKNVFYFLNSLLSENIIFDRSGFFVYWHINLQGLFHAEAILVEEQQW